MLFFKTAFLELKGRFVKTLILFLIFLLLFSGVLTALTLLCSANNSKSSVLENIGASITLDYANINKADEPLFTSNIIDQLSHVENVVGVNQNYADFALPVNFENNKSFIGQDPYMQKIQIENEEGFENNVVLEGNIRTDLVDMFRNNAARIVKGTYPIEQQGALISNVLAKQNNLAIGDVIKVSAYGTELSLPVVGIYDTVAQFQVTSDNIIGAAVFAYSPYNRIYVDIDSFSTLFGIDKATLPISIYINSPNNVQVTGERIKSMDFNWDDFRLINTTATEYSMAANNIESITRLAELFVVFFTLVSSIVMIIVMSIWADSFQYESGIYLSLGTTKWRTIGLLLLSTTYIAIPALIIAMSLSEWIAQLVLKYQVNVSASTSTVVHQFITGVEMDTSIIITRPDLGTYTVFLGIVIWIICLACLLPSYAVLKLKPREILARK